MLTVILALVIGWGLIFFFVLLPLSITGGIISGFLAGREPKQEQDHNNYYEPEKPVEKKTYKRS